MGSGRVRTGFWRLGDRLSADFAYSSAGALRMVKAFLAGSRNATSVSPPLEIIHIVHGAQNLKAILNARSSTMRVKSSSSRSAAHDARVCRSGVAVSIEP